MLDLIERIRWHLAALFLRLFFAALPRTATGDAIVAGMAHGLRTRVAAALKARSQTNG